MFWLIAALVDASKGMYSGASFAFSFAINTNYPHEPPKVKCIPKVCILHHLIIDK